MLTPTHRHLTGPLVLMCFLLLLPYSQPKRKSFHCYQCLGDSNDPSDQCTDAGWVAITRATRLDYKFLCPAQLSSFCMTSVQKFPATKLGQYDRYRMRRGCSGPQRVATRGHPSAKTGRVEMYTVRSGCTDYMYDASVGAETRMCFCDTPLCNHTPPSTPRPAGSSTVIAIITLIIHSILNTVLTSH